MKLSETKFAWNTADDPAAWDSAVAASSEGTLFSESLYLDAAGRQIDQFIVQKGHEIKAAVCLVRTNDGAGCELDDLVIHGGIMFLPAVDRSAVKQRYEEFDITDFVIGEVDRRYRSIEMPLAPQFQDLRPFLWHCYGHPDPSARFALDLRYTSYVDVSSLAASEDSEQTACFSAMDTLRRRHVRDARRKGGSVRIGTDSGRFIEFYRAMMERQNEQASEEKLARMAHLIAALLAAGRAAVYEVLDGNGNVLYVTIYAWDAKRAYYLFGAGHPDANEPWQGTMAHWEAFKDVAGRQGLGEVDLEGVNSPKRGWFKLGFGGDLRSYYHVRKGA